MSERSAGAEESLDAVASAAAFLSHLLLRRDAGPAATASLSPEMAAAWPLARDADTAAGVALLVRAVEEPASDDDLQADYAALFVGPGPMLACPYESVHRSEEHLTFEEETHQVRAAYAQFGLAAPRLYREPDDHIGLEVAFVGELAARALEARGAGGGVLASELAEGARGFVVDHLEPWVPGLAGMVIEGASTDLYRALGYLLRGAVGQFGGLLGEASEVV